ncbi:Calx-beta domain-containing protein [Roseofilum casamattae]|uniref:Calx-beta domain-containing protein n=1 Tax=Roseofilum casamattae BLCC-M143 TaxID=3022442 RepID=A0ABT7BYV2_9CYAN|nr:Calx-beta domain-containing protein [Roseofilum casamattae]MDJ1183967.1 Calx-beta domain-containing protein [Roseofilum casamattae BLCC-M143]
MSLINNTTAQWTVNTPLGNNNFYLNNNFSSAGNPLAGAIDGGPVEYQASNGTTVNSYNNGTDGAKSALELGIYIFFAGDDTQGIRRIDNDWSSNLTGYQGTAEQTESITTDGTSIYGNNDVNRDQIIKWSVTNNTGSFSLAQQWAQDVGTGGRFRGISYFDHGSGDDYIYASDGGTNGASDKVWAFDADTGSATAVNFGGTDITVPGTDLVYQAIAHEYDGRTTLIAVTTNEVHVWDLNTPTTVSSLAPQETYTLSSGSNQLLNTSATALSGNFYGAGAKNNQFFLLHGSQVSAYELAPTPLPVISEIMYNPASGEDDWEWIEVYNSGSSTIDLSGYVLDDNNSLDHMSANIASGTIAAGTSAILFNDDDLDASDFTAAWGTGINLIGVTGWGDLQLNNAGDTVSLWNSFASYSGDHTTHTNAIETVTYDNTALWPADNNSASIYLTNLSADNNIGSNWSLSTDGGATPTGMGYISANDSGNSGNDIGSPGGTLANIAFSSGTIAAASVLQSTNNHPLYQLDLAVTTDNVQLTGATFTTGGTYITADIVANSFELFYSTDTTFDAGDTSLGTQAVVTSGNTLAFTGLSQTINSGSTGTLFLVADIAAGATAGNTINMAAPSLNDITFTSGKKTGTPTAAGAQTFDALPTISSITSSTANDTFTAGSAIDVTVNFSENVTLVGGNLTLNLDTGGVISISPFANSNTVSGTYIVGTGENSADLNSNSPLVLAGAATLQDGTGNNVTLTIPGGQSLADNKDIIIDTTAPAAPSTPDLTAATDTGSSNSDNITNDTTPTFTGTAAANSTVTLTSNVDGIVGTTTADGAGNWTITASTLNEGSHNLTATATDTGGNASAASSALGITIDTTSPTVTVNQAVGQADPTSSAPINYTVIFNEAVTGFATGDASLSGTAPGTSIGTVTGSGTTYNVAASGMTASGTVIASLAANVATDTAGNGNAASTSTDNTVTVNLDTTAPTLSGITRQTPAVSPTNADSLVFRATFDEDVQNVDIADFTVTGTTAAITNLSSSGSGAVYEITVSGGDLASLDGTVGLDLAAGQTITDLAANSLLTIEPATDETYTIDNTPPTVGVNSLTTFDSTPELTGTVDDTSASIQVTVNGTVYGATNGGDGTWTLADNTITIPLNAGTYDVAVTATDSAGNAGNDSMTDEVIIAVPVVEFAQGNYSASEGDGTTTIITLERNTTVGTSQVRVAIAGGTATEGTDYTGSGFPLTVIFNDGEGSKTVALPVLDDTLYEPGVDETIALIVTSETNANIGSQNTTILNIADNDSAPNLSINDVEANEGDGTLTFTVTLDGAIAQLVTVDYGTFDETATAGDDYNSSTGTLAFNPGETSREIAIALTEDNLSEGNETFVVDLTNASNANISNGQGQGTIVDNDMTLTVPAPSPVPSPIPAPTPTPPPTPTPTPSPSPTQSAICVFLDNPPPFPSINITNRTEMGGEFNDVFVGGLLNETFWGRGGNDWILGGDGDDNLNGEAGDDFLIGNTGKDIIEGGFGNDEIHAGQDDDGVRGGEGGDRIYGNIGNDILEGNNGNDFLFGNTENDYLDGGFGDDFIHAGQDNDGARGGAGNDTVLGDLGQDCVGGNEGNDMLSGNRGSDRLEGHIGDDTLWGGRDNDTLFGGTGDDFLSGDLGSDRLIGGFGNDTFVLKSGDGIDWIADFSAGDRIGLAGGLTFQELEIAQSGNSAIVSSNNQLLATLENTSSIFLTFEQFITV